MRSSTEGLDLVEKLFQVRPVKIYGHKRKVIFCEFSTVLYLSLAACVKVQRNPKNSDLIELLLTYVIPYVSIYDV